jgi:N-methylhydantoinase A
MRSALNLAATSNRLAIDIGGTFTDVVLAHKGDLYTTKALTTPSEPEIGVMEGVATVMKQASARPEMISGIVHGTTLATNALIERKGAVTALVTTEGFRDVLDIAYENRYDQYDVFLEKPLQLVPRYLRFPVKERMNVHGEILVPLDQEEVAGLVDELRRYKVDSVAVGFLHSYANTRHEQCVRDILRRLAPELSITLSAEVCPEVREFERFSTTVANAYVQPLMARYLTALRDGLQGAGYACPMLLMTSGGGMTSLETAISFPIRLVESGPSGGAVLAACAAAACGERQVLSFDMGGTTAKISLIDDYRPEKSRRFEIARAARFRKGSGLPVRIPVIDMIEIGAGGGSIVQVDALGRLTVGPESVGSKPGPACYGRGGEQATVTDADVVMGRIAVPALADGQLKLDVNSARRAIEEHVGRASGMTIEQACLSIGEVVDENMANAGRVHAVERGKDLTERTLIAFGGAGPLHAARLAQKLGIPRVIVPCDPGVGSAVGFLMAPVAYEVVSSRYMLLSNFDVAAVNAVFDRLHINAVDIVRAGAPDEELTESRNAYMRYVGQGHEIAVEVPVRALTPADGGRLREIYESTYRTLYGRVVPDTDIEILLWTLSISTTVKMPQPAAEGPQNHEPCPAWQAEMKVGDTENSIMVPVYRRPDLRPGACVRGPAIVAEGQTSTVVPAAFDLRVDGALNLVLDRRRHASQGSPS